MPKERPYTWISGHGVGSANQFLADVNADNRADAVIYIANTGSWYVALSTGSSFAGYTQWTTGHGVGSANQVVAVVPRPPTDRPGLLPVNRGGPGHLGGVLDSLDLEPLIKQLYDGNVAVGGTLWVASATRWPR